MKVSTEVRSGTARFQVAVRTESARRAVGLVGGVSTRYARVSFPSVLMNLSAEHPSLKPAA